jgi:hypothetical protein
MNDYKKWQNVYYFHFTIFLCHYVQCQWDDCGTAVTIGLKLKANECASWVSHEDVYEDYGFLPCDDTHS